MTEPAPRRPRPTIGDATSAAERAADPTAWAMPEHIPALADVVAARRDIRRYRPDPVPPQTLRAVLGAGHRAPSVGQSQPWRFIVVTAAATRDHAARLADRARLRQAALLEPDAARRLLDLQLDGIREAPVGIVVACDRRTPAAGVLGRATFTDADLWSCACAIQNMWLTARAHGLGLGWVTLFEPAELAALVELPAGVESLGWLCLGWPDERPPEPGLERAGWSRREPLDAVVMAERWTDRAAPVSHRAAPAAHTAPDQAAVVAARDAADALLTTPGSLGVLDRVLDRALAVDPAAFPAAGPTGALLLAAGDHGVVAHGVSAFPAAVTADIVRATAAGTSMGAVAAEAAGLEVVLIDAGVGTPTGDIRTTDALDAATHADLVARGRRLGRTGTGVLALGEVGVGNTTVAAALAAHLMGRGAAEVVGLGASSDSAMLDRKRQVVADALARLADSAADPDTVLRRLGGAEFAVLRGAVLGAAEAGRVVVLDGLATAVAALIAVRADPWVQAHLVAGQRSRETAHAWVLAELGLEPLLDVRLRAGEGVGAALAVGLLRDAATLRRRVTVTRDTTTGDETG